MAKIINLQLFQPYREALSLWWQSRARREQLILFYGIIIALLIIVYFLVEGVFTNYNRVNRELPQLKNSQLLTDFYVEKIISQQGKKTKPQNILNKVTEAINQFNDTTITTENNEAEKPKNDKLVEMFSSPKNINKNNKNYVEVEINLAAAITVFQWLDFLENSQNIPIAEVSLKKDSFNKLSGKVLFGE